MAFGLIVGAQNFANFGLIAGKISGGDKAAVALHVRNQHLGCFAAIKISRSVFSDALQSGGQFRLAENISDLIGLAVVPFIAQKNSFADGELLQARFLFLEFVGPVCR